MPGGERLPMPWDTANSNFSVHNNIETIIALWWWQAVTVISLPIQ